MWLVATALCNIQQYEDWENANCLDVLVFVTSLQPSPPPLPQVLSEFQCDQALCTLSQKAGSFLVTLIGECQIMNLLCTMLKFTLNKRKSFASADASGFFLIGSVWRNVAAQMINTQVWVYMSFQNLVKMFSWDHFVLEGRVHNKMYTVLWVFKNKIIVREKGKAASTWHCV